MDDSITESPWYGYHTPRPGDLVVARTAMRAWEQDDYKGVDGIKLKVGDRILVVQVWSVGSNMRLRALAHGGLYTFSCAINNVHLNWGLVNRETI